MSTKLRQRRRQGAVVSLMLLTLWFPRTVVAQTTIDTSIVRPSGDTLRFWARIPPNYRHDAPPAILVWWHGLGGLHTELPNYTAFDEEAESRGWISCCHFGQHDRHWNERVAQGHCREMLQWIDERYPFSHDSIYMSGSSMGAAAGLVWHNNNCSSDEPYFIAAASGGSPILDCELRARQYLAADDTNRSMRMMFGGLPDDGDSVAFEYHRYSAVYLADTAQSMHYNSMFLPAMNMWGSNKVEWNAYGFRAYEWDALRNLPGVITNIFPSGIDNHGFAVMNTYDVCQWMSQFSANRQPDFITISADDSNAYYWTRPSPAFPYEFARYAASRSVEKRHLHLKLIRNVAELYVNITRLSAENDTLHFNWRNFDPALPDPVVVLYPVTGVRSLTSASGQQVQWSFDPESMTLRVNLGSDSIYTFVGEVLKATPAPEPHLPYAYRISSIYPNPFNSEFTLRFFAPHASIAQIRLFDMLGRVAWTGTLSTSPGLNSLLVPAGDHASGTYWVTIGNPVAASAKVVLIR